jgi:hypothetical protein
MTKTYKHFRKHEEIFLGLSFFTLLKLGILSLLLGFTALSLGLAINSPLFLFLSLLWILLAALIIKADSGTEVRGFYSSLLLHPFSEHLLPLFQDDGDSIFKRQNLKSLGPDYGISKQGDLLAFIKLYNGVNFSQITSDERRQIINSWGSFLTQLQSISSVSSYFIAPGNCGDALQAFVIQKPYEVPEPYLAAKIPENENEFYAQKIELDWYQKLFKGDTFIPELEFYLIIRHRIAKAKIHSLHAFLRKVLPACFPADLSLMSEDEFEQEHNLLRQKIDTSCSVLLGMNIQAKLLSAEDLYCFSDKFLPLRHIFLQQDLEENPYLEDKSKYLKFRGKLYKVYRVSVPPDDLDLDFWLLDYLALINSSAYLSVQWIPRDALADRRSAERKADIMTQLAKSSKSSTLTIIQENKQIAEELINNPFSFDINIFIVIIADDLADIQKLDNRIKRPVRNAVLAPLDRQQINNWINALPFAYTDSCSRDRLFAGRSFAESCFPFVKSEIGTPSGPLMGLAVENLRPVFLDEYDRNFCNNRSINFIGDSGSGKTVAAKLALKRRLKRGGAFIIIDNTQDGWQFFVDYFGGETIEIDTSIAEDGRTFFAPLALPEHYSENDFNAHLENLSKLLSIMRSRTASIEAKEKTFLLKSFRMLYERQAQNTLSDLYQLWSSKSLSEQYGSEYLRTWVESIEPYCRVGQGIYAGLMDGLKPRLSLDAPLSLFTFSKLDKESASLPVSLYLLASFVSQRVLFHKETKLTLIVDEAWKIFSATQASVAKDLLTYLARAGRGMDLGLWTISQKPADLPRDLHSSASCSLCFQLKESQDRKEMAAMVNLNEYEKSMLDNGREMAESGIALMKSTRSSGLIRVLMDPLEEILCNSTRDFVNVREEKFLRHLGSSRQEAALATVKEIMEES